MLTGSSPEGVKVLSVSELTQEVKAILEDGFAAVWVAGEVSNLARPSSGHVYLTLKDSGAQVRAVVFRGVAMRLRFELHDGLDVIARGRLSVYQPRGEYQLVVEELQPKGLGALELALRQLREKLFRLGYFAPERKKPLPRYPRRVALVTSPTGAAVRDMLEILGRRWPAAETWVCPVRVQGDGAAQEVAAALQLLNRLGQVDVIIVGRGGGSVEDLWAFNEECVAQAIFYSRIPVVSAVGHEIDLTIADLVADRRALTPSEAAELVTPNRWEIVEGLRGLAGQLRAALWQRLELARGRLLDLAQRRAFRLPLERVRDGERRVDELGERLRRAVRLRLDRAREALGAQAAQLESLSPLNVLGRGYSLTRREADQVVVRHVDQVRPGDRLVTYVQHGRIVSRVEDLQPADLAGSVPVMEERPLRMESA
jgi:exodeoxyribonuclease VII large subunit